MPQVYLSMGGNLGDPVQQINSAIQHIDELDQTCILERSPFYESEPWGVTDQPNFINAALSIETAIPPFSLLAQLQDIENAMGRVKHRHWGTRNIDLDIITYGNTHITTSELTVPHRFCTVRDFVMVPLNDIAPTLLINGVQVDRWCQKLNTDRIKRLVSQ